MSAARAVGQQVEQAHEVAFAHADLDAVHDTSGNMADRNGRSQWSIAPADRYGHSLHHLGAMRSPGSISYGSAQPGSARRRATQSRIAG